MPACHRRSWHVPNEEHRPPTLSEPPRVPFFSAPAPQPLKHKERLQLTREINTLLLVHVPNRHIHWEGLSGPRGGGPRLCPVFPLYPGCWGLPMAPPHAGLASVCGADHSLGESEQAQGALGGADASLEAWGGCPVSSPAWTSAGVSTGGSRFDSLGTETLGLGFIGVARCLVGRTVGLCFWIIYFLRLLENVQPHIEDHPSWHFPTRIYFANKAPARTRAGRPQRHPRFSWASWPHWTGPDVSWTAGLLVCPSECGGCLSPQKISMPKRNSESPVLDVFRRLGCVQGMPLGGSRAAPLSQ